MTPYGAPTCTAEYDPGGWLGAVCINNHQLRSVAPPTKKQPDEKTSRYVRTHARTRMDDGWERAIERAARINFGGPGQSLENLTVTFAAVLPLLLLLLLHIPPSRRRRHPFAALGRKQPSSAPRPLLSSIPCPGSIDENKKIILISSTANVT